MKQEGFKDGTDFEAKLDAAMIGLKDALGVIGSLEAQIKDRADTATRLKSEIEHYKGVQSLQKEQVDAVAAVLQDRLKAVQKEDQKRSLLQDIVIGTAFMILGATLSYFISKWLGV
jgi:FtsZ-binding cell division protein ZapB